MAGSVTFGRLPPRLVVFLGVVLCAQLVGRAARAGDDEDLAALLDEHVVSGASKTEELAEDAPATTSVITADDMRRYGIRTIAEAINFLGMGLITHNPLHSVEVGGRGVLLTSDFGNHVLLVVDGHVYNEPWGGTAYFEQGAGIPIELIDHVELILGPGSVLYGGNAMIGVVNVITRRASSYKGLHLLAGAGLSPQQGRTGNFTSFAPADLGGTYRVGVGLGHELTLFGQQAQIVTQAEVYQQSGPSFEWGPQVVTNADGTPYNFGPRTPPGVWGGRVNNQYWTFVPTLHSRMQVGDLAIMFRGEINKRATPVQGFDQQTTDFDEPRSWERDRFLSLDVQYKKRLGEKFAISVRGYADAYDYYQQTYNSQSTVCAVATAGPCLFEGKGHSSWVGTEVQGSYDWTGRDRYTTLVGLNGIVRDVGGETDSVEANTGQLVNVQGQKSATEIVRAAYIQQRLTPVRFLHLNVGLRYDWDPRGGERLAPRAAAALDLWRGGVLKLIYAEAFRAPNFFEAFYESPVQKPNPSIRSEYVRGAESTIEQRFGQNKVLFGVFRTWWSDMLSIETLPDGVLQYQNVSAIDNYGYNTRAEGSVGSFRYGASLVGAYTRRTTPEGQSVLPVAPQFFGNARVSYSFSDALPTIGVATSFVGKRPADRILDGNFNPPPHAPPSAEIRLTLSQQILGIPGLSYRFVTSYTTGNVVPYVAGPTQTYSSPGANGPAELTPVVKLVVFGSLRFDLPL